MFPTPQKSPIQGQGKPGPANHQRLDEISRVPECMVWHQ